MRSLMLGGVTAFGFLATGASAASIGLDLLGVEEIPSFTQFNGTTLGGLSGLTYDPATGTYIAVSDDRDAGDDGTPRVYALAIDLSDGTLDDGDVTILATKKLLQSDGTTTLDAVSPDPEGIAQAGPDTIYIASERNSAGRFPQILTFNGDFVLQDELPVDDKFNGTAEGVGVGNNVGFESLTITPDGTTLYTATEAGLEQDGGRATLTDSADARILTYDLGTGAAVAEYVYQVDPIANAPIPADAFADSGLVELLALPNGTLLALERSFSIGAPQRGYTGKIYEVSLDGATNVIGDDVLGDFTPVTKSLVVDLKKFGFAVDNVEGLSFGPEIDGRPTLIVMSDDNFSAFGPQANQFIAFAITPIPLPASGMLLLAGLGLLALRRRR